jgi:hypothetical protein
MGCTTAHKFFKVQKTQNVEKIDAGQTLDKRLDAMIAYIGVGLSDLGTMDNLPCAFIVRISAEAFDNEGNISAWHGYIESVENHQRMYFSNLESIARFIQEQINLPSSRVLPRKRSLWEWVRNGFKSKAR